MPAHFIIQRLSLHRANVSETGPLNCDPLNREAGHERPLVAAGLRSAEMPELPPNATAEQIEDEIIFTRIMITSLDQDSDNYDADKERLEAELATLESRLAGQEQTQPDMNVPVAMRYTGSDTAQMCDFGEAGNDGNTAPWASVPGSWSFTEPSPLETDSAAILPPQYPQGTSEGSSASVSSEPGTSDFSYVDLQAAGRKRPRTDSRATQGASGSTMNKSRRTTPISAATTPSTPGSVDSLDLAEQGFEQQHGNVLNKGTDSVIQRALERQKAAAEAAAQQRRDAELARALGTGIPSRPQPLHSTSQAMLNRDGTYRRPARPAAASTSSGYRSQAGPSLTVKLEGPNQTRTPSTSMPGISPVRNASYGYGTPNASYESETASPPSWAARSVRGTPSSISTAKPGHGAPVANSTSSGAGESSDDSDLEEISPDAFMRSAQTNRSQPHQINHSALIRPTLSTPSPRLRVSQPDAFGLDRLYTGIRRPHAGPTNGQYTRPANYGGYTAYQAGGDNNATASAGQSWMSQAGQYITNAYDSLSSGLQFSAGGFLDGFDSLDALINGPTLSSALRQGTGNPAALGNAFSLGYTQGHQLNDSTSGNPYYGFDSIRDLHGSRYDYLYSDPTKTKEEINKLLENIRPDEELPPEMREGTPEAMKNPLFEHQKLGLTWLKKAEEGSNRGGILADDMGLGKTIQALALIVSRPSEDPRRKTTLIVAPVALMRQWKYEIANKLKGGRHAIRVHVHHGPNKRLAFKDLRSYDVVLTTFGTLASELKRKEAWDKVLKNNPNAIPGPKEQLCLIGDNCRWYRVIIDEAQCIKNSNTQSAKAACELQSTSRFCMTGTPMMNHVGELYSLIHFLRIKPYNELSKFNVDIKRPLNERSQYAKDEAMKKLQALCKAIMLRRSKQSMIDGKPIINLPPRSTEIEHVVFSKDEDDFYKALETQTQLTFNKYLKAGTVGKSYQIILVLLLRLRQACCHPHLIKDFSVAAAGDLSVDDMETLAASLHEEVVHRIKETGGAFECPVCYDAVENPAIFIPCGHDTCSECFVQITHPSRAIAVGDANGTEVRCPECRGKIDPKKVIDYNAFKKVHLPDEVEQLDRISGYAAAQNDDETDSEGGSDSEDPEDETSSLDGFIVDDDAPESEGGGDPKSSKSKKAKKSRKQKKDIKGKGKAKDSKPKTLAELKKEGTRNAAAKRKYLKRLRRDWITSAKIDKTMEILRDIDAKSKTEKTIVFSQFTSLLDLMEVPVDREGWGYKRYDGSMSANLRADAVAEFMERPECKIMLVSLKAGNAGLNLTAASQVIILDPFWNPYIEEQAIDRAHRIGQMREVKVHRVLTEGTVEDRIIDLQEKKRALISTALDEKAGQSLARLGVRELAYLFVSRSGVLESKTIN